MAMSILSLPDSNLRVLEHLSVYRFLTVPQMIRLGVAKHKPTAYNILKRFNTLPRKLVEKKDFGFIAGVGNLHSVYYLTRQGAAFLADVIRLDPEEIKYPKGVHVFARDYFHRIATVDIHIAFRTWAAGAGAEVDFFDTYFDKTGSNRKKRSGAKLRAKTRVDLREGYFIPDGIFMYTEPDEAQRLTVLEVHNGMDTGRFMKQVETHIVALEEGAVSEKYGLALPFRMMWVFELEAGLQAAIRRMRKRPDLEGFREYVYFNTIQNVRVDFTAGWRHF